MKLSTRIGLGFLALLALMIAAGAYQLAVVDSLREEVRHVAEIGLEKGELSLRLRRQIADLRDLTLKLKILRDAEYARELGQRRAETATLIARLRSLPLSEAEAAEVDGLAALWQAYEDTGPRAEARVLEWGTARSLDPEVERFDEMRSSILRLATASGAARAERAAESAARAERARWISWIAWLVSLLVAVATSVLVVRSIARSLARLQEGADALGAGDLSYRVRLSGPPEFSALASDFNAMADRLEELERLKKDFVSMVSHELKAPLASMRETLELVLDGSLGPLSEEQQRILRLNRESAERLSGMIHDLLDLACLEAGAMEYDIREHDLGAIVRAVVEEFAPSMRLKGVRALLVLPDRPVQIPADAGLLRQVLQNLVSNAVKFTSEDGAVEVAVHSGHEGPEPPAELRRRVAEMPRSRVALTVADSGPGIPDEHKARIFERFHRVDSRAKGSQGTGLGLAIARGIVAGHGGEIWAEDRPGGGTRFVVLLPGPATEERSAEALGHDSRLLGYGSAVLLCLMLAGCSAAPPPVLPPSALTEADRRFEERRYAEAAEIYRSWLDREPAAPGSDHALFRLALAHLSEPDDGAGARTARTLLRRLVEDFPDSPYRPAVEVILGWRSELERVREQLEELKRIDLRESGDDGTR